MSQIQTDAELFERLRKRLQPIGQLEITRLELRGDFFTSEFVESVVRELETCSILESISPAQKLALCILMESAHIGREDIHESNLPQRP